MLRSRVSTGIDVARLSNAVSRPGIDPRVWVSYAVLISEPYIESQEGQQDVVVDIQLMPTGEEETARVGAIYAGNGFGFYAPLHEGDEVLVCAPSGDPDEGLVVMQRLWSPADPPPQAVYENPEDMTLVVESGKNLRMKMLGSGTAYITAEDGKVVLGDEAATRGVARVDDTTANGTFMVDVIPPIPPAALFTMTFTYTPPGGVPQVQAVTFLPAAGPIAVPTVPPIPRQPMTLSGKIDSASEKVVAS